LAHAGLAAEEIMIHFWGRSDHDDDVDPALRAEVCSRPLHGRERAAWAVNIQRLCGQGCICENAKPAPTA
jgi:hypothetical protein